MSHELVNFDVPTGLNWNEHSSGFAITTIGALAARGFQRRVGVVCQRLEQREVRACGDQQAGHDDRLAADAIRQRAKENEETGVPIRSATAIMMLALLPSTLSVCVRKNSV